MEKKTYVLLKDLPNIPAGTEVTWNDTSTWVNGPYKGGRYGVWDMPNDFSQTQIWTCEDVEDNPDWFRLKEETKEDLKSTLSRHNVEQHLDKMVLAEEAFNAARLTNPLVGFKYDTYLDFLAAKEVEKEEPKPDWEIVAFCRINEDSPTWVLDERGLYKNIRTEGYGWLLYELLNGDNKFSVVSGHGKIHTVKRISDGEVFSIGDKVKWHSNVEDGAIERFEINHFDNTCLTAYRSYAGRNITSLEKVKEALLITEDGVDVYEGDKWVSVQKETFDILDGWHTLSMSDEWLNFSTKEAAEEFILFNKPYFSITDISEVWGGDKNYVGCEWLIQNLKQLAISKTKKEI